MITKEQKKIYVEAAMSCWNENNFCKGNTALDKEGHLTEPKSSNAAMFCAIGKLEQHIPTLDIVQVIRADFLFKYDHGIGAENDTYGQAAVKEKLLHLYD